MKPKLFIGSSSESADIAYALQQNLHKDAEVTVWNQGAFELSQTTIESLISILQTTDFGVFVFSPDDITKMRETKHAVVRDNVIFELGLFIGKLGRERSFIVIPDGHDLHIPSDLLGVTPGKFESKRDDKNLLAATGPVSNQIRHQINKQGILHIVEVPSIDSNSQNNDTAEGQRTWTGDLLNKNFKEAIPKINKDISEATSKENAIPLKGLRLYAEFMLSEGKDFGLIDSFIDEYKDYVKAYQQVARILMWRGYNDRSLEIIQKGLELFHEDYELLSIKTDCLNFRSRSDEAIELLKGINYSQSDELTSKFANIYVKNGDFTRAKEILRKAYIKRPTSESICYELAKVEMELLHYDTALFLFVNLHNEIPNNYTYPAYISNCCVQLGLADQAMHYCMKANELAGGKEAWILANIGNMLNNVGFSSEAIKYLKKSLNIEIGHGYSHDRMASAIKKREEEQKKLEEAVNEGKAKIYNFISEKI